MPGGGRGALLWILPLYLQVDQKSNGNDDDDKVPVIHIIMAVGEKHKHSVFHSSRENKVISSNNCIVVP